ncbi:hypothetical protein [uncultured Porphyromonas sp.]|uniref:hypothetical protein n=1 Tax=uncultured Porphyromonas sp. TaxID=159274 RepID=UPI002630569A|nr:hypothetical protein [uncultured Porphyromonas sp.]
MNRVIITEAFISEAADILGDTNEGLTGSEICKLCNSYAVTYNRKIPYAACPFKETDGKSINKRTALRLNLQCFSDAELYIIIRGLCEHERVKDNENVVTLKTRLLRDYSELAPSGEVDNEFREETSHWLEIYPEAYRHYNEAYRKYKSQDGQLYRNLLDDARLSLEVLLKAILSNNKSLENQQSEFGKFIREKGGTTEFSNMFWQLLNYYSRYQNNRVKHDEDIAEVEITFIFELTTVFIRQLVRLNS